MMKKKRERNKQKHHADLTKTRKGKKTTTRMMKRSITAKDTVHLWKNHAEEKQRKQRQQRQRAKVTQQNHPKGHP